MPSNMRRVTLAAASTLNVVRYLRSGRKENRNRFRKKTGSARGCAPPGLIELLSRNVCEVAAVKHVGVEATLQETRHHSAGDGCVEPASSVIIDAADLRGSSRDIARRRKRPERDGSRKRGAGSEGTNESERSEHDAGWCCAAGAEGLMLFQE